MLAQAFLRADKNCFGGNILFCSGVSNSKTTAYEEFARECKLLKKWLCTADNECKSLIYFSTCSVYDSYSRNSPYVQHKLMLEALVRDASEKNIILRLPQVVGIGGNPKQLLPYLIEVIRNKENFNLSTVERNLIYIDDLVFFLRNYLSSKDFTGGTIVFAAKYNVPIIKIVDYVSEYLDMVPSFSLTQVNQDFAIPVTDSVFEIIPALRERDYWKYVIDRLFKSEKV